MPSVSFIEELPNELLLAVIEPLPTPTLLDLMLVSHRVHTMATEALKRRLLATADLGRHEILLECYHPAAKLTTPSLACRARSIQPLGSPLSSSSSSSSPSSLRPLDSANWALADLGRLYSHFRVEVTDTRGGRRVDAQEGAPKPTQHVFLDDAELFSQLCASTSIVRQGPRPGIFLSHHGIGEGVVRVWRDWLAEAAGRGESGGTNNAADGATAKGEGVLWADAQKNVGLRFTVRKTESDTTRAQGGHLLVLTEEPPVEYTLQYEELLVRTTKILRAMEKSAVQEITNAGNAIVIASYQV
ncbi:hypothetical protein ACRALDRAFT_1073816 [Sodiomyces alcalophilus JCM 7366]|uniref:uncharacterized protein n=1 Tax=Sodiomyces alcalophilus JCM 7366 TaxID=591952 RepID=UPI0039B40154